MNLKQRLANLATGAIAVYFFLGTSDGIPSVFKSKFKNYFANDQLSYAAIVENVRNGGSGLTEPFTDSGHLYYPSGYYRSLGVIAKFLSLSTEQVWSLVGVCLLLTLFLLACYLFYINTDAKRVFFAPALCLPLGVLANVTQGNGWYFGLQSHAVLWPGFGALYPLNAESIGFGFLVLAISIPLSQSMNTAMEPKPETILASFFLVGFTFNLHAYIFFLGTFFTLALNSVIANSRKNNYSRKVTVTIAYWAIIAAIFSDSSSPFVVYFLFIIPFFPDFLNLLLKLKLQKRVLTVGLLTLSAAPQLVVVLNGIVRRDPFLTYRQASSIDLGVNWVRLGIAMIPTLCLVLCVFLITRPVEMECTKDKVHAQIRSVALAIPILVLVISKNDLWGFNQEPYRFAIDSIFVSNFVLVVINLVLFEKIGLSNIGDFKKWFLIPIALILLLSMKDAFVFKEYTTNQGYIDFQSSEWKSAKKITSEISGRILPDPCIRPEILKVATGKSISSYNRGISWPADKKTVDSDIRAISDRLISEKESKALYSNYIISSSKCAPGLGTRLPRNFKLLKKLTFVENEVEYSWIIWEKIPNRIAITGSNPKGSQ